MNLSHPFVKFAYIFWHLGLLSGEELLQQLESKKESNGASNVKKQVQSNPGLRRLSEGKGVPNDLDSTFNRRITRSMTQGTRDRGVSTQKKASNTGLSREEVVIDTLNQQIDDPNRPSPERPTRNPNTETIRDHHLSYCKLSNPSWKLYQEVCARNPIDPIRQWLLHLKIPCSFDITMAPKRSRTSLGSSNGDQSFSSSRGSSAAPISKASTRSSVGPRHSEIDSRTDQKVYPR
jgi:hypothetical protein